MIVLALCIFSFCSWGVFSHRFDDGIIVKNFLSLAAILASLVILDHDNQIAAVASATLMVLGLCIWVLTHRKRLKFIYANRPPKAR